MNPFEIGKSYQFINQQAIPNPETGKLTDGRRKHRDPLKSLTFRVKSTANTDAVVTDGASWGFVNAEFRGLIPPIEPTADVRKPIKLRSALVHDAGPLVIE